ncbi:FUSC family protein [Pantoea ananatis]|uniref:FUSC family protein n=1 Tax=Pantoea ananas TaxID=553 RepID=UPI0022208DF7|nr:FUSC family protein [Pantoea ananatis]
MLFRHGLRIGILLTTAFVCRPNYGATRLRLAQRIAGTLIGLGAAWALMQLFPGTELQLLFALLGTLVFVTRTDRYMLATAAITVMALRRRLHAGWRRTRRRRRSAMVAVP